MKQVRDVHKSLCMFFLLVMEEVEYTQWKACINIHKHVKINNDRMRTFSTLRNSSVSKIFMDKKANGKSSRGYKKKLKSKSAYNFYEINIIKCISIHNMHNTYILSN